jgi:hypothetical protein
VKQLPVEIRMSATLGQHVRTLVGARWRVIAAMLLAMGLLQACGDQSDDTSMTPTGDTGQVTMALRDAAGDFVSYAVDVTSLKLQRADGSTVETMPLKTRIDFTQVADLTEFFTIATVPAGTYTRAVLTLDFTNAQIFVQNDAGGEVQVAAVDATGAPLTTLQVAVDLPDSEPIRIVAGIPAAVTLDFNLDASNAVDSTITPTQVVVQPFLSAVTEFEQDREHRIRGVLASVDTAAGSVTVNVRPFRAQQNQFGQATFDTDDQTNWEINGTSFTGADGLTAFAALATNTPVTARGTVSGTTFTADTVLAGSSVAGSSADVVYGIVTARSGDTLTVKGAHVDFRDGTFGFRTALTVTAGNGTRITAIGVDPSTLNRGAISVGQRIAAFGALSNNALDATAGRVRLEETQVTGHVVRLAPLVMNVDRLGGLHSSAFDFAGTGATQADPTHFVVDIGTLTLTSVLLNDVVQVRGLVHAFGAAPPNFDARTVVDVDTDSIGAWLDANWRASGGSSAPFTAAGSVRIDVDLSQARHTLNLLGLAAGALQTSDAIALLPSGDVRGVYLVTVRGSHEVHVFRDFASLVAELNGQLQAGNKLIQLEAVGRYNATTQELTTPRAMFEFTTP